MRSELVQGRTQWKRRLHSQELHRNETPSVSRSYGIGCLGLTLGILTNRRGFLLKFYQLYSRVWTDKGCLMSFVSLAVVFHSSCIAGCFGRLFWCLLWCVFIVRQSSLEGSSHKPAKNPLAESFHYLCPKKSVCVLVMILNFTH